MNVKPVTIKPFKPAFRGEVEANKQQFVTQEQLQSLITKQPQYMPAFKPGWIATVRAKLAMASETVKGTLVGLSYGLTSGVAATAVAAVLMSAKNGIIASKLGKAVAATAVAVSAIAGATAGDKKGFIQTTKGAFFGALYGLAAGLPAAAAAMALQSKGIPGVAKGILIAASAVTAVAGAIVGKMLGNEEAAKVYMQHGAVHNLLGKQ